MDILSGRDWEERRMRGIEEYKYVYPSTDKYRMNIGRGEEERKKRKNRRMGRGMRRRRRRV